jgi:hypothetical protein
LQSIALDSTLMGAFEFALLASMPALVEFGATAAGLTTNRVPPSGYGGGLTGGALTHFILRNLNSSNPLLQQLTLSQSSLNFSRDTGSTADNFPHPKSSSLTLLDLSSLPQLRTGPTGPADDRWLADLPSLQQLDVTGLSGAVISTSAFAYASGSLVSLSMSTGSAVTLVIGNLQPLLKLSQLTSLGLDSSGIVSELPANISAYWPNLEALSIRSSGLFGQWHSLVQSLTTAMLFSHIPSISVCDVL